MISKKKSIKDNNTIVPKIEHNVPKRKGAIGAYIRGLTPEQKKAHYEGLKQKIKTNTEERHRAKAVAQKRAQEMLPELIAHQISESIAGTEFNPTPEVTQKLRALLSTGIPIHEIKTKYFKEISQNMWEKMTRFIFKDEVAHAEDLGINLSSARKKYLKTLQKRIKELKREIKLAKKDGKSYHSIMAAKAQAEDRLYTLEADFAETLKGLDVVGEKAKAASINIHMSVPRPSPKIEETTVDVTPKTQNLSELL